MLKCNYVFLLSEPYMYIFCPFYSVFASFLKELFIYVEINPLSYKLIIFLPFVIISL